MYYLLISTKTRGWVICAINIPTENNNNSFYIFRRAAAATKILKKAFEKMCKKQNGRAIYLPESMEER